MGVSEVLLCPYRYLTDIMVNSKNIHNLIRRPNCHLLVTGLDQYCITRKPS